MSEIVTHLGQNYPWISYKNGHNQFTVNFTLNGSAYDISTFTFTVNIRKVGDSTNQLSLTQGSGVTNGGVTGLLTIALTQTQSMTTLPGDFYFYEIIYVKSSKTYSLFQGQLNLLAESNSSSTSTSITAAVSLAGTALTADVSLSGEVHYLGLYISLAALNLAVPTGNPGDYADVDAGIGTDVQRYLWDSSDSAWKASGSALTSGAITTALGYVPAEISQTITNGVTTKSPSEDAVFDALALKQAVLVSGANIKTVGGLSVLGAGNIPVGTTETASNGLNKVGSDIQLGGPTTSDIEIYPSVDGAGDYYIGYDSGESQFVDTVNIAATTAINLATPVKALNTITSYALDNYNSDLSGSYTSRTKVDKAYVDSQITAAAVGLLDDRGNYNASVNTFPASGGSGSTGTILKGDLWTISVAGTLGGTAVTAGDVVRALVDTPGQTASNWVVTENNIGYAPENPANKNASGGYAGLTLFKINFKNALNTFTSFFTNSNTAARTYTFQDRDGTIADDTDLALKVSTSRTINGQALSSDIIVPHTTAFYRTGQYITNGITTIGTQAGAFNANTLRAFPIVISKSVTVTEIISEVTTLSGGTTYRIGIYTDNGVYPSQLVSGSDIGTYDSATTGVKSSGAVSLALTPGLYWLVVNSNGAAQFRGLVNTMGLFVTSAIGANSIAQGWSAASAYSAMPGSFPGGASVVSNSVANLIGLKT